MSFTRPAVFALCLIGTSISLVGCGEPAPEFGQVTGTLTVKGKPVPQMAIRFIPEAADGNAPPVISSATTDAQGKYELRYYYRNQEGLGAPVGHHRVLISDTRLGALAQGQRMPPQIVPLEYSNPATSPLEYDVAPGVQTIDITLGQ
jgi:hypothetical protein